MLEITDLSVSYGDNDVVRRASLSVPSGSITVVVGPNGCGKTTFLRAVCGLLPTTSGRVLLDGVDVTSVPTHKRGIGMLFQSTQLFPADDVFDNVVFGLRTRRPRLDADEMTSRVDEALRMVGMADLARADVGSLSGGQSRRVDIARVLAPRPRALLLDEPMSMLDADSVKRLTGELRNFVRSHSMSVICITHDADEATMIGDTIVAFTDLSH